MVSKMKKYTILLLSLFARIWLFFPKVFRLNLIKLFLFFESRNSKAKTFDNLFNLYNFNETLINERALFYNNGIHPKHKLINYHQFFISNISNNEKIIDLGCGYGEVAYSIAKNFPNNIILGVDIDEGRLNQAITNNIYKNLSFTKKDIVKEKIDDEFDTLILSNVLEHIDERVFFLKKIIQNCKVKKILIRIPSFERSWMIPFMKELKINYFSDEEHFIEHKKDEIIEELKSANLNINSITSIWGEFWISTSI